MAIGAPKPLIAIVQLPAVIPGVAQWISPFAAGAIQYDEIMYLSVTGFAAATLTIHLVPPAGAPTNANKWFSTLAVGLAATIERLYQPGQVLLPAGYSIFAFASAVTSLNLIINGNEYS